MGELEETEYIIGSFKRTFAITENNIDPESPLHLHKPIADWHLK